MKNFFSLRTKLLILLAISIVVPFLIYTTIIYTETNKRFARISDNYINQLLQQVITNLDNSIQEMGRLTMAPLFSQEILNILKKHSARPTDDSLVFLTSDESLKLSFFISSLNYDETEIGSIRIFTNDGLIYNNYEYASDNKWTAENNPWMKLVDIADGELVILPPHTPSYFSKENKVIVSVCRIIRDQYTMTKLGVIKIDLTEDDLKSLLYPAGLVYENRFYIFDHQETMIFPMQGKADLKLSKGRVVVEGVEYYADSLASSENDLIVYSLTPYASLTKDASEITKTIVRISLILLLIACFSAIYYSNRLIEPLKYLENKIREVRKGNFNVNLDIRSNDEIGVVTDCFNKAIEEINRLVKEVYQVKLQEKEAEIIALESQINPHFLYNTLESINMMALQKKQINISDTVTMLGKMLRYTVSKQVNPVRLRSEIMFVDHYLKIQALRQRGKFDVQINVDASLEDCLVPKLILQPFVENIIEHAIKEKPVQIRISAKAQDDDLVVMIQDDGEGMPEERILAVEEQMYSEKVHSCEFDEFDKLRKGHALRNVHQRIYLRYGKPYGILIDRQAVVGATFFLRLPLVLEETENDPDHVD